MMNLFDFEQSPQLPNFVADSPPVQTTPSAIPTSSPTHSSASPIPLSTPTSSPTSTPLSQPTTTSSIQPSPSPTISVKTEVAFLLVVIAIIVLPTSVYLGKKEK